VAPRLKPLALAVLVAALPATALGAGGGHAELWATVNVCDPPTSPGAVGVRVSIPPEKGAPRQWADIHLQYFDAGRRAWRRVRSGGDAGFARLGLGTRLVQGGTTFTFPLPAPGARAVLRGVVDVEWRRGTTVVDRARLMTTAGHADAGDPLLRQSLSSCEIRR
jgi:hypothetical protein